MRNVKWKGWMILALAAVMIQTSGCNRTDLDRPVPSDNAGWELEKARHLIGRGDYQAALLHLQAALALSPRDPDIHRNLAWLYLYTNEPDKARQELERLEELQPGAAGTLHLKGALLAMLDQHEEAVPLLEQALAKDKRNERLYFDLATSLAALNRNRIALQYLDEGFHHIPDEDLQTHLNYLSASCTIQARLRQFDRAIEDCTQAAELTPSAQEKQRLTEIIHNLKLIEQIVTPE